MRNYDELIRECVSYALFMKELRFTKEEENKLDKKFNIYIKNKTTSLT